MINNNNRSPLKKIQENFICAEIGVWQGDFSKAILNYKPSLLYLIDPWQHQNFDGRFYSIEQEKIDKIYLSVVNRFKNIENVKIIREFSTSVNFDNEYFDWVYIDGNHSYNNVLKDLEFYYCRLKPNGYLCGDDYGWHDKYSDGGPKRAVDEFVKNYNLPLIIDQDQFIIQKVKL